MKPEHLLARLKCIDMGRIAFYLLHRNEDALWLDEHFRLHWLKMWPEDQHVIERIVAAREKR